MKKPHIVLLFITTIFLSIMIGIFIGRNTTKDYIALQYSCNDLESHDTQPTQSQDDPIQAVSDTNGRININSATKEQLVMLPGIGEVLAGRIIDYRTENGPFSTPEELINVEGIGEGKLKEILEYITVGG